MISGHKMHEFQGEINIAVAIILSLPPFLAFSLSVSLSTLQSDDAAKIVYLLISSLITGSYKHCYKYAQGQNTLTKHGLGPSHRQNK